uniref:Uncharacterized protein n=1 Tax=Meloidogyne enterolobii TaxID=390850 RepID=A0A6V7V5M7_MELEN|nr:unnamed protein product [Meloidogyne enterolobii]
MEIPAPIPIHAVERELRGSRQSLATVLSRRSESPQRAQHAFYRARSEHVASYNPIE